MKHLHDQDLASWTDAQLIQAIESRAYNSTDEHRLQSTLCKRFVDTDYSRKILREHAKKLKPV